MIISFLLVISLVLSDNFSQLQSYISPPSLYISNQSLVQESLFNQTDEQCLFNVSQSISGAIRYVAEILEQPCTQIGGYYITLLDSQHNEHLVINQNSTIFIKGANSNPTIWSINFLYDEMINLQFGNLTIENIELHYSLTKDSKQIVTPWRNLIKAVSQKPYSFLTMQNCVFQSIALKDQNYMTQMYISYAYKVELINCNFSGILNVQSCVTMISMEGCREFILKGCRFQDVSVSTDEEPIVLYPTSDNGSINIQDCEFRNIHIENNLIRSVIKIYGESQTNVTLMHNTFTNCQGFESEVGALLILDNLRSNEVRYYIINNNTFNNNTGKFSGSIFLFSDNLLSNFNFNFNSFINSSNNQTVGQDAFLNFSNPPDEWTKDNIKGLITAMFNGSTSDILNGSVYYEMHRRDEETVTGNITLPNPSSYSTKKWYQNKYAIIGIICGSLILLVIVAIIILYVLYWKKKKSGSLEEKQLLIDYNQQESI